MSAAGIGGSSGGDQSSSQASSSNVMLWRSRLPRWIRKGAPKKRTSETLMHRRIATTTRTRRAATTILAKAEEKVRGLATSVAIVLGRTSVRGNLMTTTIGAGTIAGLSRGLGTEMQKLLMQNRWRARYWPTMRFCPMTSLITFCSCW